MEVVLAALRAAVQGSQPPDLGADVAALRAQADALGTDEAYTSHVAMGSLLASRCAACCPVIYFLRTG